MSNADRSSQADPNTSATDLGDVDAPGFADPATDLGDIDAPGFADLA